ncbi:Uracil phosphoribosyltransferase [Phytophthora citrophthora]|uniref:Uracil phosphoribosyltransferase n=1 Tax=Phytophthora citrophthora TaxID=4793 RepID=A0AAD9G8E1_9STRA|nr:Uracil phosphoribosyltransferase [Phytophthora citrophthora]
MYSPTYKNLSPGGTSYAVSSPDGAKRHMVSGPPPRRLYAPHRDSPPLPGLSSMLQQRKPMLTPNSSPTALMLNNQNRPPVTTPSTSSETSNGSYQSCKQGVDLQARKAAAHAVAKALAPTVSIPAPAPMKSSRYLREIDRRAILSRIQQGEKQSALAKEYQVSRAAICNLNKHRDEVLSRKDSNPLAKHPKKPRPKTLKAKLGKSGWATAMTLRETVAQEPNGVHEIKSRSAALLLTSLRKKHATVSEFRRCSDRLMRIVMEEALAHVPVKTVEIFLPNHNKSDGVALEHPPCAISMEPAGCPMLDLFHLLEPDQPTGYVSFGDVSASPSDSQGVEEVQAKICGNRLPGSLNYHNVFIMDHVVTSAEVVIAVVRRLQEHGAVEAMISLVALVATPEAVQKVHAVFPALKIVVAQVDNGGDEVAAPSPVGHGDIEAMRLRASATDMILDRLEQVYHGLSPATPY